MNLIKYSTKLIKTTFPIVAPIFKRYKPQLAILIFLSILLGFIPTIKSGIESNFLNEASSLVDKSSNQKFNRIGEVFNHTFENTYGKDNSFFDNIPNVFTNGNKLWVVIIFYFFAIVITLGIEYVAQRFKTLLNRDIFVAIREAAFKKALNAKPNDLPQMLNSSGNFASSIQIGTGNISNVYDFLASSIQYLFLLITSLIVLFTKAWLFGILFQLALLLQVFISVRRAKKLKTERKELEKKRNSLIGQTEDIISKKEIILAFEQEERYSNKIKTLSHSYGVLLRSLDLKGYIYTSISRTINEIERFLIPVLTLVFIVYFDSKAITSIGGVFFLITLYSRLGSPILAILSQYDSLKENEAISNSLIDLLNVPENSAPTTMKSTELIDENAVVFENVLFRYSKDKTVLTNCNFTIPKNKTTIILGPSGCGKSSIAKIILGFWRIENGIVTLMGQPLTSYSDKEIRLFTSYISQGDYIVDDTIRDNLNWGMTQFPISDEAMIEALINVKILDNKSNNLFLDKYAKDLSGGEQQRLSLARILIDESELLILDEPLTGVDVYTIKDIMPTFKKVLKHRNRTVILISHKLSFVNSVDNVILIDKLGNIIETGNPKDLYTNKSSTFFKLYESALNELTIDEI